MLDVFKILNLITFTSFTLCLTSTAAVAKPMPSEAAHIQAALKNMPAELASVQTLSETNAYYHYKLTPTAGSAIETVHETLYMALMKEIGPAARRTKKSQHWTQAPNGTQIAVIQKAGTVSLIIDNRLPEITRPHLSATVRGKPVTVIYTNPKRASPQKNAAIASPPD